MNSYMMSHTVTVVDYNRLVPSLSLLSLNLPIFNSISSLQSLAIVIAA